MTDTSGPIGSPSSPSADLQSSLESKLRARLGVSGSLEYVLTWKHWDMLSGPPICRLRALARRIYVNAYGGVPPTLTARDYHSGISPKNRARRKKSSSRGVPLNEFMHWAVGRDGKLNPMFACLWMGFPPEWDACAPAATPLSRKSRRSS